MPLLEVIQTKQISASIRLTDSTAMQVDRYATFIGASADDVVEQALTYVFSKDRDFQDFLKSPSAEKITSKLRIRKPASKVVPKQLVSQPVSSASLVSQTPTTVAGSKA